MDYTIPVTFWSEPVLAPASGFAFSHQVSSTSISAGTGIETWNDADVSDSVSQNTTINWNYTPAGILNKPTYVGGTHWNATLEEFEEFRAHNTATISLFAPVAQYNFEYIARLAIVSSPSPVGLKKIRFATIQTGNYLMTFYAVINGGAKGVELDVFNIINSLYTTVGPFYTLLAGPIYNIGFKAYNGGPGCIFEVMVDAVSQGTGTGIQPIGIINNVPLPFPCVALHEFGTQATVLNFYGSRLFSL